MYNVLRYRPTTVIPTFFNVICSKEALKSDANALNGDGKALKSDEEAMGSLKMVTRLGVTGCVQGQWGDVSGRCEGAKEPRGRIKVIIEALKGDREAFKGNREALKGNGEAKWS